MLNDVYSHKRDQKCTKYVQIQPKTCGNLERYEIVTKKKNFSLKLKEKLKDKGTAIKQYLSNLKKSAN